MDEKLATAEALIIEGKDTMRARCSMIRHVSHEVRLDMPHFQCRYLLFSMNLRCMAFA